MQRDLYIARRGVKIDAYELGDLVWTLFSTKGLTYTGIARSCNGELSKRPKPQGFTYKKVTANDVQDYIHKIRRSIPDRLSTLYQEKINQPVDEIRQLQKNSQLLDMGLDDVVKKKLNNMSSDDWETVAKLAAISNTTVLNLLSIKFRIQEFIFGSIFRRNIDALTDRVKGDTAIPETLKAKFLRYMAECLITSDLEVPSKVIEETFPNKKVKFLSPYTKEEPKK